MKTTLILLPSVFSLLLASCANKKAAVYDTSNPYGYPDASFSDAATGTSSADTASLYDTPAVYEESTQAPDLTPATSDAPATFEASASHPTPASTSIARTHTVVRGDTLSGISSKYKVSVSAIKKANNMKNDIVVLGRKLKIPAR